MGKSGFNNGPSEYAPGEEHLAEEYKNGEPIKANKRDVAQPLIEAFGESSIRKIFSSTWGLREDGIGEVEDQVVGSG